MPKFVCPACRKVLIRSVAEFRLAKGTSFCDSTGKSVSLTRLRIKPRRKAGVR